MVRSQRSGAVGYRLGYEVQPFQVPCPVSQQEKNTQDILSAAHQHKVTFAPSVESHSVLPSDCSATKEHIVAVPISPPTLYSRGKCRGHHLTGWTNEHENSWLIAGYTSFFVTTMITVIMMVIDNRSQK